MERAPAAGTSYGKLRLWGSVGFLAAAFLTGRVIDVTAPAALPAVIGAGFVLALLAAWALPAKPRADRVPVASEARALLAAPDFAGFLVAMVLAQLAHSAYDLCFSLHFGDLGASGGEIGAAWAAGVFFEVALMAFADPLLARFGAPPLVAVAILGAAGRWLLIAMIRSRPVLLVLQPLHAVSFSLWWIASLAYIKDRAPARALATAQGVFSAAVAAGSVTGMLAWGALYHRAGGAAVFTGAAAVALAGGLVAVAWARFARVSRR
jgi:PPP family 3-phenylpropionic acid transporter